MKVHLIGHRINPYTYELIKLDTTVNIDSVDSAIKWAKQSYFKCQINSAKEIVSCKTSQSVTLKVKGVRND